MRCRAVRSGVKLLERHSSGVVGFNTSRVVAACAPRVRLDDIERYFCPESSKSRELGSLCRSGCDHPTCLIYYYIRVICEYYSTSILR